MTLFYFHLSLSFFCKSCIYMKQEIMTTNPTPFEIQEQQSRQKFIQLLGKWFYKIKPSEDPYSHYDLDATGNSFTVYKIELKERSDKYSLREYSGRTWIEDTKLNYFKSCFKHNPNIRCLYFVFFKDGYISYDITGRLQAGTSEVLYTFMVTLPSQTLGTCYGRQKWVGQLAANPIEYQDKIFCYPQPLPIINTNN
jgi:hypothetical protein